MKIYVVNELFLIDNLDLAMVTMTMVQTQTTLQETQTMKTLGMSMKKK